MNTHRLSQFEKRMLREAIQKTTGFTPDLKDIQVMNTQEGADINITSMKVKRFETVRKGWMNGYFNITILTGVKAIFLMVGDSSITESEYDYYFPREGDKDSSEWKNLKEQISPEEDGLAFINKKSNLIFTDMEEEEKIL